MTKPEWLRLRGYFLAKRKRPTTNSVGRRHAKGRGKAVGQVLKNSRVREQIPMEKLFIIRK